MTRFQIIGTYRATGFNPRDVRRGILTASEALSIAADSALSVVNLRDSVRCPLAMSIKSVEWHGEHCRSFRVAYVTNPQFEAYAIRKCATYALGAEVAAQ